jgi:hypothetical protein
MQEEHYLMTKRFLCDNPPYTEIHRPSSQGEYFVENPRA